MKSLTYSLTLAIAHGRYSYDQYFSDRGALSKVRETDPSSWTPEPVPSPWYVPPSPPPCTQLPTVCPPRPSFAHAQQHPVHTAGLMFAAPPGEPFPGTVVSRTQSGTPHCIGHFPRRREGLHCFSEWVIPTFTLPPK